jgi:hypothetical protein
MLYGPADEIIQYTETEVVVNTPDVQELFERMVGQGMRPIRQPVPDAFYGVKAFVQDSAGVLIELRSKEISQRGICET